MYQGKYSTPKEPKRKRRLKWRKEFAILCSIAVLLMGFVGGTIAYLTTSTTDLRNSFLPAITTLQINENFSQGGSTKSNVTATNTGNHPVYIRATYVAYWMDEEGKVAPGIPALNLSINTNDWTQNGNYWYYKASVAANGGTTTNFINSVSAAETKEGCHLVVDVIMESIQSEGVGSDGFTPVQDIWGYTPAG